LVDPPTNLIAQAASGSGKTAAFTLGILARIDPNLRPPQALVLSPTRELAVQTTNLCMIPMSQHMAGITCRLAVSGDQFKVPRREVVSDQIVVSTPGTIDRRVDQKETIGSKGLESVCAG
jgi:ATP-dependent RNA helicase DDX19/DBP5